MSNCNRYSFEIYEWSLPRGSVTPVYLSGPGERMMKPEDPIGFISSVPDENGTITFKVIDHSNYDLPFQYVTTFAPRSFLEELPEIMSRVLVQVKRNYSPEP